MELGECEMVAKRVRVGIWGSAAVMLLFMAGAGASEQSSKVYAGVSIGPSFSKYLSDSYDDAKRDLAGVGAYIVNDDIDKQSGALKVFVGMKSVSEFIDLQISLVSLGRYEAKGNVVGAMTGNFTEELDLSGVYLAGLLKVPVGEGRGSVYGKAGIGHAFGTDKSMINTNVLVSKETQKDDAGSVMLGVGFQYDLNERWGTQIELERYFVEAEDYNGVKSFSNMKIDLFTLGVFYRF